MKTQQLQLWKMADLIRFRRYVRKNGIHGTVRQNRFVTGAGNMLMLALALPLEAATLEITAAENDDVPAFDTRSCPAAR